MYEHHGAGALDYSPCRYGRSRLLFRGPERPLDGAFCTILGGTETYGKYIARPYPHLVEAEIGHPVVNLGLVNAGIDVFAGDGVVQRICDRARVSVLQVLGAQNMSNRFYSVHPRRNDRFLTASAMLQAVYREVDFTEFHFTRHMLGTLQAVSAERFLLLVEELKAAWLARMRHLAGRMRGARVLLWLSSRRPGDSPRGAGLGQDPLFVDRAMIDAVRPLFTEYVEVVASPAACARGIDGMVFPPLEQAAAAQMPGPAAHGEVAAALAPVVARLMG
ncbi:DUF6473 family protein [Actibacterium sp. MT2.3-13A]|uniref:DUF6473 family protein n=1 Tax=Actibacterium sp. MT2.3-13A TaxID=2828332 RepID=UPI001BA8595E|nr:DUF6473 family protein [Actibacterium sp. MT2.3-13A]